MCFDSLPINPQLVPHFVNITNTGYQIVNEDYSPSSTNCNIRPNTTQRRSVEKVPINDWQASVTLILLVFHRLDLASCFSGLFRAK